jgi:hypothetical protein
VCDHGKTGQQAIEGDPLPHSSQVRAIAASLILEALF